MHKLVVIIVYARGQGELFYSRSVTPGVIGLRPLYKFVSLHYFFTWCDNDHHVGSSYSVSNVLCFRQLCFKLALSVIYHTSI